MISKHRNHAIAAARTRAVSVQSYESLAWLSLGLLAASSIVLAAADIFGLIG